MMMMMVMPTTDSGITKTPNSLNQLKKCHHNQRGPSYTGWETIFRNSCLRALKTFGINSRQDSVTPPACFKTTHTLCKYGTWAGSLQIQILKNQHMTESDSPGHGCIFLTTLAKEYGHETSNLQRQVFLSVTFIKKSSKTTRKCV
jgi:hypothetical protein